MAEEQGMNPLDYIRKKNKFAGDDGEMVSKEQAFDEKCAAQLMLACNAPRALINALKAKGELSLSHFVMEYGQNRVPAIESYKLPRAVDLNPLMKAREKDAGVFTKAWHSARENWPDTNHVAVVFNNHRGPRQSLVLINTAQYISSVDFYVHLADASDAQHDFFLQRWEDFCESIARRLTL